MCIYSTSVCITHSTPSFEHTVTYSVVENNLHRARLNLSQPRVPRSDGSRHSPSSPSLLLFSFNLATQLKLLSRCSMSSCPLLTSPRNISPASPMAHPHLRSQCSASSRVIPTLLRSYHLDDSTFPSHPILAISPLTTHFEPCSTEFV